MKTHGDAGWESLPSYLDVVVPRFLAVLDTFSIRITVFVVGQDAALEGNHAALRSLVEAGHEIGNHSFHHEPWLHLYSGDEVAAEIERAETAIESATGVRPRVLPRPRLQRLRDRPRACCKGAATTTTARPFRLS